MTTEALIKQIATHSIKTEVKLTHTLSKIEKITQLLVERFDKDGTDDLNFPKKITFFSVIANVPALVKLLRQIFETLKEQTPEVVIEDSNLDQFLALNTTPEPVTQ